MALTEAEEKQLKDGLAAANAAIESMKPAIAEVPGLKASLAAKDTEIADLKKQVTPLSVNGALQALKTSYPDVPEATLSAVVDLPADKQKAVLAPAQTEAAKLKASLAKTDPLSGWSNAGSIEAMTDAERTAKQAEERKAYDDSKKAGDLSGMLSARAGEIGAFVRRAFAPR